MISTSEEDLWNLGTRYAHLHISCMFINVDARLIFWIL